MSDTILFQGYAVYKWDKHFKLFFENDFSWMTMTSLEPWSRMFLYRFRFERNSAVSINSLLPLNKKSKSTSLSISEFPF